MKRSHARTVTYFWVAPDPDEDRLAPAVEYEIDDYLRELADAGVVYAFDTGRGTGVWWTAAPGPTARRIRDWIRSRLPANWRAGRRAWNEA